MGKTSIKFTSLLVDQMRALVAAGETGFGSTYGDSQELIEALVNWGHEIEGHDNDSASKPLLACRPWAVFTLRRTPPTIYTPRATGEPVLRFPYVWMVNLDSGERFALLLFVADKSGTSDEKKWYKDLSESVKRIVNEWRQQHPNHHVLSIHGIKKGEDNDK